MNWRISNMTSTEKKLTLKYSPRNWFRQQKDVSRMDKRTIKYVTNVSNVI